MSILQHKIDFALVLNVSNANPNGDPLNGNRPRTSYDGIGEITDVCLKRKLRDRLQESGEKIFVQSDDRRNDEYRSLAERARGNLKEALGGPDTASRACKEWFDVRAFGQLFAIKAGKKTKKKGEETRENEESESDSGISIGIRGPVTMQSAFSHKPVEITSTQITKSVSGEGDGSKRGSDTMGMKHRVDQGTYICFGSMNPSLAERTGFSEEDAAKIKAILPKLLENDASSARPEGSMEVQKMIWWQHSTKSGVCSSAKVHRSLLIDADGNVTVTKIDGIAEEIISGF
ncbi:MAG: CRISPR-associated protein Csd2 family [Solimicrobium sp.]|jgi:CRISPR-associated protein Csd2|nr:CRISPR-associated protein Csd2 family [Solimicrobium sp.]